MRPYSVVGLARFLSFCIFALLATSCFSVRPASPQSTTGRLEGRVLDPQGAPVPDAAVAISSPALQGVRGCLTSKDGHFVFFAVPVGVYGVRISHTAFQALAVRDIRVRLAQTTTLGDLRLSDKIYEMPEVTVVSAPLLIDPHSTEMGATLVTKEYEALPLDRDYRSVVTLLPQVTQSYYPDGVSFAGATGKENRYFIDGVDVSDALFSQAGTGLPYNFVQEVEVRTGGYEAEYRSSLGGEINAVTYSGGNTPTRQIFGYFTNDAFMGTPRSRPEEQRRGDFALYDVGIGLGGPLVKDRLWYYAAYNPTRQQERLDVTGWGFQQDWWWQHSFASKLTLRAGRTNTMVLTALGDPYRGRSVGNPRVAPLNLDPLLTTYRGGSLNFMLSDRHLFTDRLLLESSISRTARWDAGEPATERGRAEIYFVDSTGAASGGGFATIDRRWVVTLSRATGTWNRGSHELKMGLEYKDVRLDTDSRWYGLTEFSSASYQVEDSYEKGRIGTRIPSAFLQDSWRIGNAWTLNAGLRWDAQYLVASDGKVAQSFLDEWQPRAGFTFRPGGGTAHKVFGSFGRFYQELALAAMTYYYNLDSRWSVAVYDHDPRLDPAITNSFSGTSGVILPAQPGLKGQHFDEFTLGYEHQLGAGTKAGLRGIYRTLRKAIEDGYDPVTGEWWLGNPGSGHLSAFPNAKRNYSALELSCSREQGNRFNFLGSYVLSRTYGNYAGLYDKSHIYVNMLPSFDFVEYLDRGEGLLYKDRTHVLKLAASYRVGSGVTAGAYGFWESGTPLDEYYYDPAKGMALLLRDRGSAGRTPSTWDLNLRLSYQPAFTVPGQARTKLTLDFLHLASQRTPVSYFTLHYRDLDAQGNPIDPNPQYDQPALWQPPMMVRLGAEVQF